MSVDAALRAFQSFMQSGPGSSAWLVALLVVTTPATLLHEVGHAVAARRLLGGRVRVRVGAGSQHWRFTARGIDFEISPFTTPIGHAGSCIYEGRPAARDALLIALAGPAATATVFALSLLALPSSSGRLRDVLWVAVTTQGAGLVLNLVPFRLDSGLVSDGHAALDALRASRPMPTVPRRASGPPADRLITVPAPIAAASPRCARCGHGRDEHIDLATGSRSSCRGQDFDFQILSARLCSCTAYVRE